MFQLPKSIGSQRAQLSSSIGPQVQYGVSLANFVAPPAIRAQVRGNVLDIFSSDILLTHYLQQLLIALL